MYRSAITPLTGKVPELSRWSPITGWGVLQKPSSLGSKVPPWTYTVEFISVEAHPWQQSTTLPAMTVLFLPLFNSYFNLILLFIFIKKLPAFHSFPFMMLLVFISSLSLILQLFSWRRPTSRNILIYCITSMLCELLKKSFSLTNLSVFCLYNTYCTTLWLWYFTEALCQIFMHDKWTQQIDTINRDTYLRHYHHHSFTFFCRKYKTRHIYFIVNFVILIMATLLVTGSYIWTARKALTNCFTIFLDFLYGNSTWILTNATFACTKAVLISITLHGCWQELCETI